MRTLKNKFLLLITISFTILGSAAVSFPVEAAPPSDAGFYVQAILPENQLDRNLTYFDLRMAPGQTQQLEIEITNQLDTSLLINIETISASTNRHGIIDYTTPSIHDKSLRVPFSTIANTKEDTILIPAKSSETAVVNVEMPNDPFDGVILGGLVFTREKEKTVTAKTTTINNIFSYVVGVKLSENDVNVSPQFELTCVTPKTVNYQPEFVHAIRNTQAAIAKDVDVTISVQDQDGVIWAHTSKTNIDMAPNSTMPLGVALKREEFKAGTYLSEVLIRYNEEVFNYQEEFVITAAESDFINDGIISEDSANIHLQHILLALLLTFIIVISLIVLLKKKHSLKGGCLR